MYRIAEKKAGDFIDLESWFKEILEMQPDEEQTYYDEIGSKFFISLIGRLYKDEEEAKEILSNYITEIEDLKQGFEFIYNPPDTPSSIDQLQPSIGDEYRKEFSMIYGGYVEIVYLLCSAFKYKPHEVLEMKTQDMLFWANYLLHKKFVENIK